MALQKLQQFSATVEVNDSTPELAIYSIPGNGKVLRVQKVIVQITVAAAGGGGEVFVYDNAVAGAIEFIKADADAVRVFEADFGEIGFPITTDSQGLMLLSDLAATTQATARATVIGYIAQ